MKTVLLFFVLLGVAGGGALWLYSKQTQKLSVFGIVDGTNSLGNIAADYRNEFHGWGPNTREEVKQIAEKTKLTGSSLLLTVEPWPIDGVSALEMFRKIRAGEYDEQISGSCIPLQDFQDPILRWGHEAETVGSRYPWAVKEAQEYVTAFQYVTKLCRSLVPKVKIMWSPAGLPNLEQYYPGAEYVDYIGLSIFGYPEYEIKSFRSLQSFDQVAKPRYDRILEYQKPVIIAELGCAGSNEYKLGWLREAIQYMKDKVRYPLIEGFVLFSGRDATPWIPGINPPDFTLTQDQVSALFIDAKKEN